MDRGIPVIVFLPACLPVDSNLSPLKNPPIPYRPLFCLDTLSPYPICLNWKPDLFQTLQTTDPSSQPSASCTLERHARGVPWVPKLNCDKNILQVGPLHSATHPPPHHASPTFSPVSHCCILGIIRDHQTISSLASSQAHCIADHYHTKSSNYQTCLGPSPTIVALDRPLAEIYKTPSRR